MRKARSHLVSPCFAHSGRFDMAGGRDWLYVETDQPHSTRVMAFFCCIGINFRWIGGKKTGK